MHYSSSLGPIPKPWLSIGTELKWRNAHKIEFLHRVPSVATQYFEQRLLLSEDLPPLDLNFNGLPLASCGHTRLLEHRYNGETIRQL